MDGFREVSLAEIKEMALVAKDSLYEQADEYNRDPKIYLHWSAGHYGQPHEDYHFNFDEDGSIWTDCYDLSEVKSHTWKRNTGAIGLSFEGCYDASLGDEDLGSEPVTNAQIESMARVVAVLCDALDLSVDLYHVMSHGRAADNKDDYYGAYGEDDLYGPENTCERWDIYLPYPDGSFKDGSQLIVDKAAWYLSEYSDGVENHF